MRARLIPQRRAFPAAALAAVLAALGTLAGAGPRGATPPAAYADETKPGAASSAIAIVGPSAGAGAPACAIRGTYPGPKGTQIFDAQSGGRAVAAFTGAMQPMVLTDLPADPTAGRGRMITSSGSASFRVDGWVTPSAVAVFTSRDVPVVAGHVWISEAQRVKLVQAAGGAVGVEVSVPGTGGQAARATAPCDALSLQQGAPAAAEVPGNGRGYLTRGDTLELFEEPGGSVVFSLKVMEGTAQLFWSTEARAGFVHVRGRGTLTVDAWARASSLDPLKKGEMMDQFIPPTAAVGGAQPSLDKAPRMVQAGHEIPLRARRDDKEKPIGAIEAGAEVYVMEVLLGWTNVLPKNLGLTPVEDGGFWVPSADVTK